MEYLFYMVLILVPSGIVFGTAYFFLNKLTEKEQRIAHIELRKERQKMMLPHRVEAYQRIVLFLERISPNSIVMRLHNPGLSAAQFHAELLRTIREEFEHNVAQQIFITPQAWEMVKNSKEETIKIVNIAASQMADASSGTEMASKTLEVASQVNPLPTEIAARLLKEELQKLF
jgi:hypothetical protein